MNRTLAIAALAFEALLAPAPHAAAQVVDQWKYAVSGASEGAQSGQSVAVDAGITVVGAPTDNTGASESGVAKVFDAATGALLWVLPNPSPGQLDNFGYSVAVSGTRVVVGAQGDSTGGEFAGSAYVFDLAGATPTVPVFTLNNPSPAAGPSFGNSVGISGMRVVVGTVGAQRAYVYDLGGGTPTVPVVTIENPTPEPDDAFGTSVAISGTRVVVGAYADNTGAAYAGSAYVYDLASGTPAVPAVTLNNPTPDFAEFFGSSVAISGARVVVGAPQDSTGAPGTGSAYVYDLGSAAPAVPVFTLNNPEPAEGESFGYSVAISGMRVVVGAPDDSNAAAYTGRAYVYDLGSAAPALPVAALSNPTPDAYDSFGYAVAVSGAGAVVGAPFDDTGAIDGGSAYAFGPSPYSSWKAAVAGDQFATDTGDPDRDGIGNLVEYGLLRFPTIPNGGAVSAATALYAEGRRLRMFVPRDPARSDITLEVEATGDLRGAWTTIASSVLGAPFTGPGYVAGDSATPGVKSVEVRDTVNVTDAARRWMRVRVRH